MAKDITREDFMAFFRDYDKLATLTAEDRMELFCHSMVSGNDFTKELLDEVLADYHVDGIEIVETK